MAGDAYALPSPRRPWQGGPSKDYLAEDEPIWTPVRQPSHYSRMSLLPDGFIEPCLPTVSRTVPTGPEWAFEIKHDGFSLHLPARRQARARLQPRRS
jgi:hypothetical protein